MIGLSARVDATHIFVLVKDRAIFLNESRLNEILYESFLFLNELTNTFIVCYCNLPFQINLTTEYA